MATLKPRKRPSTPAKHPFGLPEGLQRQLARAQANVAAPFTGITTDGRVFQACMRCGRLAFPHSRSSTLLTRPRVADAG